MNEIEEKNIVKQILLTPIKCSKRYKCVQMVDGEIRSPQKYYCTADCDMSDFAVGFYEIIYRDNLLNKNKNILAEYGRFKNKELAGDIINSFNSLANVILDETNKTRSNQDKWPDYLIEYEKRYHCLANFWVIPMRHGRRSAKLGRYDSFDFYLEKLQDEYDEFQKEVIVHYPRDKKEYNNYFRMINGFNEFLKIHCIENHVKAENPQDPYKQKDKEACKKLIEDIYDFMEIRAEAIVKNYTDLLYQYFLELKLI